GTIWRGSWVCEGTASMGRASGVWERCILPSTQPSQRLCRVPSRRKAPEKRRDTAQPGSDGRILRTGFAAKNTKHHAAERGAYHECRHARFRDGSHSVKAHVVESDASRSVWQQLRSAKAHRMDARQ